MISPCSGTTLGFLRGLVVEGDGVCASLVLFVETVGTFETPVGTVGTETESSFLTGEAFEEEGAADDPPPEPGEALEEEEEEEGALVLGTKGLASTESGGGDGCLPTPPGGVATFAPFWPTLLLLLLTLLTLLLGVLLTFLDDDDDADDCNVDEASKPSFLLGLALAAHNSNTNSNNT